MIKGYNNVLVRLQSDLELKIDSLINQSSNSKTEKAHPWKKHDTSNFPVLKAAYQNNWYECVTFEVCDAAKPQNKYVDSRNQDLTHIYSYNKVMSVNDRKAISKILNRTNFKIMAWYFGPRESAKAGLKRVKLAFKMPMHSTGKEKFTVYVYFKTEQYDPANPWSEDESDAQSSSSGSECSSDDDSNNDSDSSRECPANLINKNAISGQK